MVDLPESVRAVEDVDFGPLTDSLGFLLRLSQLKVFADFFSGMAEMNVRPGEISILLVMAQNPGIRQGVLAKSLMIKRAHMTKMIRAMETDGLLTRTVPEDDKRSVQLWLADKGKARIAALRGAFEAHEARSANTLSQREADDLKQLLRKYIGLEETDQT